MKRALLVSCCLGLLLSGCAGLPWWKKKSAASQKQADCGASVEVLAADQLVRENRTLRRVSSSCAGRDECVAALVERACELHADAVIVESYGIQREQQYQPASVQDEKRLQAGGPIKMNSVGPPRLYAAEGRLIVWLD
jgi:hypothetical protein